MRPRMYTIPLMNYQGTLLSFDYHTNKKYKSFVDTLLKLKEKYRTSYAVNFELQRQWFPVISTPSREFAFAVMKLFVNNKEFENGN